VVPVVPRALLSAEEKLMDAVPELASADELELVADDVVDGGTKAV
jgi:hypothetical protein